MKLLFWSFVHMLYWCVEPFIRIFHKLFLIKEITSKTGEVHFKRWRLLQTPWFGIYIHHILKSDEDKHAHSHPWNFTGLILKGGYTEMVYKSCFAYEEYDRECWSWYSHKAEEFHKIELWEPVWTLVFVGKRQPTWHYLTEDGVVDHETYREYKRAGLYEPVISAIVNFYNHEGVDGAGRTLGYILERSDEWLENCHDWVQWVFPLKVPSQFNDHAPLLTDADIRVLKSNPYIFFAAERMLEFMGIGVSYDDSRPEYFFYLADNFPKQAYTWLGFNHNALRITRFLRSISLLGHQNLAAQLLDFMKLVGKERRWNISQNTINYWEEAIV